MKPFLFSLFMLLAGAHLPAQTQMEINRDAISSATEADKELNQVYYQVLKAYKEDTIFIANLRIAQQRWIKFRDAEVDMMFPEREHGYYGSIHPMCRALYVKELTDERTKKLRRWLNGNEDDPGCTSSIRTK